MIMPFAHVSLGAGGFELTAGSANEGEIIGWTSEDGGENSFTGTVSGNLSVDGGAAVDLFDEYDSEGPYLASYFRVLNGNASATNLNVDGADYPLVYSFSFDGIDYYNVTTGTGIFTNGNTYTIEVS